MAAAGVVCLFLALLDAGWGQVPPIPTAAPAFDPDCADKLDNCAAFGSDACAAQYIEWATDNCKRTCGICQGPPTSPLPCIDVLDNCASFDPNSCTDPQFRPWAMDNCRYTCRLCTGVDPGIYSTTTVPPAQCVDKVDCRLYGKSACTGDYEQWARENCMAFCVFCTPPPTTAPPCIDKRPDCSQYEKDMCTSADFRIWAEDNCRSYCNFCNGGATAAAGTPAHLTPPPLTRPAILTPPPLPGRK